MTKRFSGFAAAAAVAVFGMGYSSALFASAHTMFADEEALRAEAAADSDGDWSSANDPADWSSQYRYSFSALPLEGKVGTHQPWSDIYWPTREAGIAARWNWDEFNNFKYRLFSESEVRAMSPQQLAKLSPAEKYDIFMGRFDYPTVRGLRGSLSPRAEYWMGICDGWSAAAIHHPEPAPVTVTGPGKVAVPFGSADVKGLLDNYYADNLKPSLFLGQKCNGGSGGRLWRRAIGVFRKGPSCDDVNAGALHVILTNELGLKGQGFIADVDRWLEVWNQPIHAYRSKVVGTARVHRGMAPGTVRAIVVQTDLFYTDELEEAMWNPVVGTPHFKEGVEHLEYALELDASGRIIGGEWYSNNRPDFLWNTPKLQFTGYMSGLNSIYRPAGR